MGRTVGRGSPGRTGACLVAAVTWLATTAGHAFAAGPDIDLACRVFVEQDTFASPLNKDGTTRSANTITGTTVGCSSPDGRYARGNREHRPVLLSSSYTSVGGPAVNYVAEIGHDCTALTQTATLRFSWNTGDSSIGRITLAEDGTSSAVVLSGVMAGDSFALSGPALADTDAYVTDLGSCSPTNPAGELDGFIVNPWLPGTTGSTGNEVGLTFTRG